MKHIKRLSVAEKLVGESLLRKMKAEWVKRCHAQSSELFLLAKDGLHQAGFDNPSDGQIAIVANYLRP